MREALETRLTLDGSGFPGNDCPPDLDLTGLEAQSVRVGEELVLDLLAAGGTVVDLDSDDNPTGDTIRFQLDPDDTPAGATVSSSGVFRWTPTASQVGTIEFVVLAIDSGDPPLADAEVFTVEVQANVAPDLAAIQDAAVEVNEMLEVMVTASDSDGDDLTFQLDRDDPNSTLPDDATLEQLNNTTAVVRWTPAAADAGETFEFSVIVTDDGFPPRSDREVFTVSVMSVAAVNDTYSVAVDGVLTIDAAAGVLANDSDSDADPLTAALVTNATSGSVTLAENGSFTYTPNAEFHGTDTFTYRATDDSGDTSLATVTVRVNSAPVVVDDAYSTDENTALTVNAATGVLANDNDPDDDDLTATIVDDPASGTVTLGSDGSFTYTPATNFSGTDSFTYRVSDGFVDSPEATVTITVADVNDVPQATADTYTVNEDMTLTVDAASGVLDNDTDGNGDMLMAMPVETTDNGTLTLASDGSFTYTPDADFHGTDTFTYVAQDGTGDSAVTTVTITVSPVNDEPEAAADAYSTTEDTPLTVNAASGVLANDTDADGDDLTAALVTNVTSGTLILSEDGSFTYTPGANFSGVDTFTYTTTDGTATTDPTTVTITVAEQNAFSVPENSPAGTVVGQLDPQMNLGSTVVYSLHDPDLPAALELAPDDHISGNPAGSVVLIEYLDFQCPVCQDFHPIVEQLKSDFPNELMVVTRHFPLLTVHENAFDAAIATEVAARQGAFDAYSDLLFDEQEEWEFATDPHPFFEQYAADLGLDMTQFVADRADPVLALRVNRDYNAALALGATGTPTFFLNGQQISNPPSLQQFASLVQAELAAVDDAFRLNRLTGQITVRDADALDYETNPSLSLMFDAIGPQGSETITATINLVDESEGAGAAAAAVSAVEDVFAEEDDWLNSLAEPF